MARQKHLISEPDPFHYCMFCYYYCSRFSCGHERFGGTCNYPYFTPFLKHVKSNNIACNKFKLNWGFHDKDSMVKKDGLGFFLNLEKLDRYNGYLCEFRFKSLVSDQNE